MQYTKVPYYILDLLQQVPSVFVPGLGRFDAIFHPSVIDTHQSQIKPPSMGATFTVDGAEDEEILPAYIHYVAGIEKSEARNQIQSFVRHLNQEVLESNSFTIDSFGTFSKSAADVLHFTPDWDAFNLSFRGLEVLDMYPTQVSHKTEPEPIQISKTEIDPEPITKVEPVATNKVSDAESETNWVSDREVSVPEPTVDTVPVVTGPVISDSTSRLWWTILIIALTLITLLCAYLAWDILSNRNKIDQYTAITNESLEGSSPDVEFIDTLEVVEEEVPIVEDTPEVVETPQVPPPSNEPPCYVVVGAFGDPANVRNMEERLKGMGYESEQLRGGNLTKVAIKTSCDKSELQKTLNEARSAINPEAWIY